jgi:hypothetical protein
MQTEKNNSRINLPRLTKRLLLTVAIIAFVFAMSRPVLAQTTTPTLGRAATFAVLGGSTVTNTGKTNVTGDVGVSPGTSITGFADTGGLGTVTGGTVHQNNDVASQNAQTDLTVTYNSLAAMPCVVGSANDLTGKDLGGMTLSPGVYCFSSSAGLTGTLHLSGAASAVYVFKIGSTLTTASNSFVIVDNNPCGGNVYWQIGSSATLGTGTTFAGNIIAFASITITTHVTISGRALARNGAVTMDTNVVTACGAGIGGHANCGENDETGDNDHHHNDKGETGDNDHHNGKHLGNNSLRDQAPNHDTDDSHGHDSHGNEGHEHTHACHDKDNDDRDDHGTDDHDDNDQGNDD